MPTRVIYLHGMGGGPEDWRLVQSRSAGISLELETSQNSPEACARSLAEEVLRQASGSFALCGYSMGGRIGILTAEELLARRRPPEALILVSTGFGFESEEERALRNAQDESWAALAEGDSAAFWEKWYQQELFAPFRSLPEATRKAWLEQRKSLDIKTLSAQLRQLGPGRHAYLLPGLKKLVAKGVRVLYIAGELDNKYEALSQAVGEVPGVTVSNIAGAGHVLPLEAPEPLALRIARFLK